MILALPFYEVNGEGQIVSLKILKYMDLAKSQHIDPEVSLELLKSAHLGILKAQKAASFCEIRRRFLEMGEDRKVCSF